jgi:hypothetical protein
MKSICWLIPALLLTALASAPKADAIVAGMPVPITSHPHQARVAIDASGNGSHALNRTFRVR